MRYRSLWLRRYPAGSVSHPVGLKEEMKFFKDVSLVACFAEFVGMALFVTIGCGSAMGIQGSGDEGGSGANEEEGLSPNSPHTILSQEPPIIKPKMPLF